ncbi:MAG: hypothetical protein LLF83_08550 [Methanobacterium sp.]|nr:hypothetical protein [Methanobacterium sp.]
MGNDYKFYFLIPAILLTFIMGCTVVMAQFTVPGGDMGQGNNTNVVTNGAYVVDGTNITTNSTNENPLDNFINALMSLFGISEEKYNITESGKTYSSTEADQCAIVVNGSGSLSIDQATVNKLGGAVSNDEESNFYGLNAAILVKNSSQIKVTNSKIKTSVNGANAIFATGNNSSAKIENVEIITTADSSRGLDATYGGTIFAKNIKINTSGAHCAALATDRGGGYVTVINGLLVTGGEGSPGIYSTGNITANDTTSTANGSEAAAIEGKNSINLTNCNITGSKKYGVFIYQSTSGDAAEGTGTFTMTGGSITAKTGPLFYSTNTLAVINLENVKLTGTGTLLKASTDNWGNSGSNGANVTLNTKNQELNGNIEIDSISSLLLNLMAKSKLIATINTNNSAKSVTLKLSADSTWNVTGNSYITVISDEDTTLANIIDNGFTIYYDKSNSANDWLGGKTINLKGGGKLTPA